MNVAPQLVVPDQQGGRSALVSAAGTQLVDSSYKLLATLPGGVSAAFSKRSDNVAVLSASGSDSVLTFVGFSAPDALKLEGAPQAMIALPDGGYLVLVDLGGRGRVSKITRDGAVFASVEVAVSAGDLIYDETKDRFTIAKTVAWTRPRCRIRSPPLRPLRRRQNSGSLGLPIAVPVPVGQPVFDTCAIRSAHGGGNGASGSSRAVPGSRPRRLQHSVAERHTAAIRHRQRVAALGAGPVEQRQLVRHEHG